MADLHPPPRKTIVGIYLRMSLDRELGIDRQREDCWKLCESLGWEGVEYVDNDKSATKRHIRRPAFDLMCKDLEADEIDYIICWRTDRLYRLMWDLMPFIDLFMDIEKRRGSRVRIETCQSGLVDLSTDVGRMNAKIMAAVSEQEGEVRTARQNRALVQVAQSGRGWGAPCFGYGSDHRNPSVVPEEAAAIRQAYKDLLAGSTLYSIAQSLNKQGFHTRPRSDRPNGNPWTGTTIRRLLDNPRMAGLRRHQGVIIGKGDWEPIVDEATWEDAHHILSDPKRRTNAAQVRKYLLGGILRCGTCGKGLMSASASGRDHVPYAVYKCKSVERQGRTCGRGVVRRQQTMDDWVRDLVIKHVAKRDWSPPGSDLDQDAVRELHEQVTQARRRIDGLAEDYADGTLDKNAYRIAKARLEGKLEVLEASVARSAKSRIFAPFMGVEGLEGVAKVFDGMDVDRQRALLEALFHKIMVYPLNVSGWAAKKLPVGTGVDVVWNEGDETCVVTRPGLPDS